MHKMGMKWFNACSLVVSFCHTSKTDEETTVAFKHTILRLFSMLHAAALAEIEEKEEEFEADDIDGVNCSAFPDSTH